MPVEVDSPCYQYQLYLYVERARAARTEGNAGDFTGGRYDSYNTEAVKHVCEIILPMTPAAKDPESTYLASKFTVRQYRDAIANRDRDAIAEALRRRFTERYIDPALSAKKSHGFAQMAIACLMLEALESLLNGRKRSIVPNEKSFADFLDREPEFAPLKGRGVEFFRNVRCGILHQAETTGGWKILRKGDLFDGDLTLNAVKFIRALQKVLNAHCDQLKAVNWGDKRWHATRRKMDYICVSCHPQSGSFSSSRQSPGAPRTDSKRLPSSWRNSSAM